MVYIVCVLIGFGVLAVAGVWGWADQGYPTNDYGEK